MRLVNRSAIGSCTFGSSRCCAAAGVIQARNGLSNGDRDEQQSDQRAGNTGGRREEGMQVRGCHDRIVADTADARCANVMRHHKGARDDPPAPATES
jgi:hypothetical protein